MLKRGVQRGLPFLRGTPLLKGLPLAGVWGCPPDIIFPPFLARKGDRGMVEKVFHHPVRASVIG